MDGKIHKLSDYAASPVLVIVFLCNHCPIASIYEQRVQKMADDYGPKGVAVVVIQPNDPEAIRVDELDSADTSDSLDEMKIRVQYKHLRYPYLYDGETQSVARALGPQATPHVFVFDKDRKLRYQGRFDNSYRVELVKSEDARNAVDALLAGKPVPVEQTGVFGCSTKWKEKLEARLADQKKIEAEPVRLELATRRGFAEAARESDRQDVAGQFLGNLVRPVRARISGCRNHIPHVSRARFRSGDGLDQHAGRKSGRAENAGEAARFQPEFAFRIGRYLRSASGVRSQMENRRAVYGADRSGREDPVRAPRRHRFPGVAANHSGEHARGLHRLPEILDAGIETAVNSARPISRAPWPAS